MEGVGTYEAGEDLVDNRIDDLVLWLRVEEQEDAAAAEQAAAAAARRAGEARRPARSGASGTGAAGDHVGDPVERRADARPRHRSDERYAWSGSGRYDHQASDRP